MGWQDQGRQQHGWFGHGTAAMHTDGAASPDPVPTGLDQRIHALAYGAVAALPARQRREAEAQYHAGLLPRLSEAMTAWLRGSRLDQASFADRFFGRTADDPVVKKLLSAVLGAGRATSHAEMREAVENLADAIQTVGLDRWPRFVADAEARARDPATVAAVQGSLSGITKNVLRVNDPDIGHPSTTEGRSQNVTRLAQIISSEAGDNEGNKAAMTAVGWTVRNRMLRNNTTSVSDVSTAYSHNKQPSALSVQVAQGILDGSVADPTDGATHFYTPQRMPNKGQSTKGFDVGGGLEDVPGVTDHNGKKVENYRPSFTKTFEQKSVAGVPEATFKFYRATGNGAVR